MEHEKYKDRLKNLPQSIQFDMGINLWETLLNKKVSFGNSSLSKVKSFIKLVRLTDQPFIKDNISVFFNLF